MDFHYDTCGEFGHRQIAVAMGVVRHYLTFNNPAVCGRGSCKARGWRENAGQFRGRG
jgi:hypothetical protein